jgi:DNA (cytosine-5)-methyltransferase 1
VSVLILSIFPGIDLLGRAFEEVWPEACVVRGPDLVFGGDVKRFHVPPRRFDGIIGGPPCQRWSRLRHLVEHNGNEVAEDLIPEFERLVQEATPEWFLMENVPDAPAPNVPGYLTQRLMIRDAWVGGETTRLRAFTWGDTQLGDDVTAPKFMRRLEIDWPALHRPDPEPTVCASGGARPVPVAIGGSGRREVTARHVATRKGASAMGFKTTAYYRDACRLQGLPDNFLADAPFTIAGKILVVGSGVPMAMGRAVARAVKQAVGDA